MSFDRQDVPRADIAELMNVIASEDEVGGAKLFRDGLFAGDLIDLGGGAPAVEILDDTMETIEGQAVSMDPMVNDTLSAGTTLTGVDQPAHGTVSTNSDGTLTYEPYGDFNGTDTFTYTVPVTGLPSGVVTV